LHDVLIFTVMCISSFSAGAMVNSRGWKWMNIDALPFLAGVASLVIWLAMVRRRAARAA
jgi:hypothetical protein